MKLKTVAIALVLLAATTPCAIAAEAAPMKPPALTQTQEYRLWSAEQMIKRLIDRMGRANAACSQPRFQTVLPKYSEACVKAVSSTYPILTTIREVAAGGDDVQWAKLIDLVHSVETGTEAPLQNLEHR